MTNSKSLAGAFATAVFLLCGSASAQSISIVSGNGQLACVHCPTNPVLLYNPTVVLVKDATGKPLPGATVSWTYVSNPLGGGTVASATTVTDANGQATNSFTLSPPLGSLFNTSFVQATITATITALPAGTVGTTGQSVTFTESNALTDIDAFNSGTGIVQVQASLVAPTPGTTLTGPAGSTLSDAIQVRVAGLTGGGVPGVAVILVPPTDPTQPTISCAPAPGGQPNTALTDASGTAHCNVLFGGRQGLGQASIVVGQQTPAPFASIANPISFQVLPGIPGSIQLVTGNNQSGNAGAALPAPLVAVVQDQAGNPLGNVDVVWTVNPTNGATLFNTRTTSDPNGRVSANATLGSVPGAITITVAVKSPPSGTNISANFTETVNLAVSQFSAVSGGGQTAPVNTAFAQPLIVQVLNNGAPVQGVTVNFAVTSGSATLSSAAATTNAQGQAQVNVQAGANAGNVVITATVGNFSQTFNLTVSPPGPALTSNSFQNAASGVAGAISPCSIATIVAQGIAPGLQGTIAAPLVGPLPILMNNTTVGFVQAPNVPVNVYAPIFNIMNNAGQEQMTIEIPCELSPGQATVTVSSPGGQKSINITLQAAAPGIFETVGSDRKRRGVIIRPDGTFATLDNPARKGERVHMLVTGVGPVVPQIGTNQVGIPDTDSNVSDALVVGVNNAGVQVTSAIYAHDLIAIYDVAFVIPADVPSGDLPLAIAVSLGGNLIFGNGSSIFVQ